MGLGVSGMEGVGLHQIYLFPYSPTLTQSFYLTPVDEHEIEKEVKTMNPKKSPEHGSIGA